MDQSAEQARYRSGCSALPSSRVNTRSVSCHSDPAIRRSASWRWRCRAKHLDGDGVERDPPATPVRLRRCFDGVSVHRGDGAHNCQPPGVKVDLTPPESEQLAASHPGGGAQHERSEQPMTSCRLEEGVELGGVHVVCSLRSTDGGRAVAAGLRTINPNRSALPAHAAAPRGCCAPSWTPVRP